MQHLETIQTFFDALWTERDMSIIPKLFSPNVTIESPISTTTGSEAYTSIVQQWLTAFPDLKVECDDFICDENTVVSRWNSQATHKGTFMQIPATGRSVDYSGVTIFTFDADKVVHYWALVDLHRILQQIQN